jgi:hypothetical protein
MWSGLQVQPLEDMTYEPGIVSGSFAMIEFMLAQAPF